MPTIRPITNYRTPDPQRGAVLPHVHDGRTWRALGLLPSDMSGLPKFADAHKVIPRKEWASVSYRKFRVPISNQGQHGSCTWHACYMAHRKLWMMNGATDHEFSPTFGYALGNGGRDAGMSISGGLEILQKYGNCLASEFPEGHIWKQDIPATAYETAKRFRVGPAYHISTFDEIVTAYLLGLFAVYDVYVAGDYGHLDRNGISPAYPGQPGNHAQTADGVTILPDGTPVLENINSWGEEWGNEGCNRLVERHFQGKQTDGIVIAGFLEDPEETNKPWRAA